MDRRVWIALVLGISSPALAGPPQLPKLLQEIEVKYGQAGTLKAEYTQVTETRGLGQKKTSSGTLEVKRPNKLRWQQQKPDSNLLVSDGKTFWFYTPPFDEGERGQVIEKKTSEVQSRLATSLLAGSFSQAAKDMRVRPRTEAIFMLQPKRGAAGSVASIEVEADPKAKTIQRVRLQHRDGNSSEITLKNIQLGEDTPDSRFEFSAPPNTDRVRE
jgi:outer membrane lipoprotein carrier protein